MSVATTARKQQFVLDQVEDEFTFTFRALVSAPSDIKCIATNWANTDVELTYLTDYTVAINANGIGGTITLLNPAATGTGTLTVYRETTNKQESDYDDYNNFPADTVETDLDIRTLISQEQSEALDRTLRLPISASTAGVSTELPRPSASKVIGWNDDATALENKTFVPYAYLLKAEISDAEAGTDDSKFMTPTMTSIMIALFASAGTSGTFTSATLSSGTLTITHNKGLTAPYQLILVIVDDNNKQIIPDDITFAENSILVDLTSFGAISGTWGYRYL